MQNDPVLNKLILETVNRWGAPAGPGGERLTFSREGPQGVAHYHYHATAKTVTEPENPHFMGQTPDTHAGIVARRQEHEDRQLNWHKSAVEFLSKVPADTPVVDGGQHNINGGERSYLAHPPKTAGDLLERHKTELHRRSDFDAAGPVHEALGKAGFDMSKHEVKDDPGHHLNYTHDFYGKHKVVAVSTTHGEHDPDAHSKICAAVKAHGFGASTAGYSGRPNPDGGGYKRTYFVSVTKPPR